MQEKSLSVKEFYEKCKDTLSLELANGIIEGQLPITVRDIHRPGLALAGFMENYLHERIQILGETEILYLNTRTEKERKQSMARLFSVPLVGIIVSRNLEIPPDLIDGTLSHHVPLLRSSMLTTPLINEISKLLDDVLAPTDTLHATLVDVYGVGLLFTGRSGIGKSEIALDLVERGHRLVADDTVQVIRTAGNFLIGRGYEHLKHFMEIRGVGIINVQDLFGIRAIRIQKRIEVEVNLQEWNEQENWERQGLSDREITILGVKIPQVVIPLYPGKNITVISEVIAMNHMLKVYGINAAHRFNKLLVDAMKSDRETRQYLRFDTE
jgi:HPr kinase/phosphorylase